MVSAPHIRILDSTLWRPDPSCWISDSLSVDLECLTLIIVSGIPNSLSWIPDFRISKSRIPDSMSKTFFGLRNPDYLIYVKRLAGSRVICTALSLYILTCKDDSLNYIRPVPQFRYKKSFCMDRNDWGCLSSLENFTNVQVRKVYLYTTRRPKPTKVGRPF